MRFYLAAVLALCPTWAVAQQFGLDSGLRELQTADDTKGWEAVGRLDADGAERAARGVRAVEGVDVIAAPVVGEAGGEGAALVDADHVVGVLRDLSVGPCHARANRGAAESEDGDLQAGRSEWSLFQRASSGGADGSRSKSRTVQPGAPPAR